MVRFQVFLSFWSVTSWLCIDKVPEVAKTEVSKPKTFFIKVKILPRHPKTAHSMNIKAWWYILLHQTHQIMIFKKASYDPFKWSEITKNLRRDDANSSEDANPQTI